MKHPPEADPALTLIDDVLADLAMGTIQPSSGTGTTGYAFCDSGSAAERLAEVNRVFEPSYRSLLQSADLPPSVVLAVDLGCGPGHTTRLLAEMAQPQSLAGIDISTSFIQRASADAAVPTSWQVHDVTTVPFPTGTADLIHARWVLAHLRNPLEVLPLWLTQLRPGGVLLIQEDERIT